MPKVKPNYNHIKTIRNIQEEIYKEKKTKVYTLTKEKRNVALTFSNYGDIIDKINQNYMKTLDEGFFEPSFNKKKTADIFMKNLIDILNVDPDMFYFEEVALNNGKKVNIPGWGGTKGIIYETRLFKK